LIEPSGLGFLWILVLLFKNDMMNYASTGSRRKEMTECLWCQRGNLMYTPVSGSWFIDTMQILHNEKKQAFFAMIMLFSPQVITVVFLRMRGIF
jgi:hypothetical protein